MLLIHPGKEISAANNTHEFYRLIFKDVFGPNIYLGASKKSRTADFFNHPIKAITIMWAALNGF